MPVMDGLDTYDRVKAGLIRVNRLSSAVLRFWLSVDKEGPIHPAHGQCWQWIGYRDKRGYGRHQGTQQSPLAHRYSWGIHYGEVPSGAAILHRCDNPSCVNPSHLFVGTNAINNLDKTSKGRQAKGEGFITTKLTELQVLEIKKRYRAWSKTDGPRQLAREFGVGSSTICRIASGQLWKHLHKGD